MKNLFLTLSLIGAASLVACGKTEAPVAPAAEPAAAAAPAEAPATSQWPELRVAIDATYKPFTDPVEHPRRHGRHQHPVLGGENRGHLLAGYRAEEFRSIPLDAVEVRRKARADEERPTAIETTGNDHRFIQRDRRIPSIDGLETAVGGDGDPVTPALEELLRRVRGPPSGLGCRTQRRAQHERQPGDDHPFQSMHGTSANPNVLR